MVRSIVGGVVGVIAGGLTVMAVEQLLAHRLHPPPEGLDLRDEAAVAAHAAAAPTSALLLVLLAWFLGGLVAGLAAGFIARRCAPVLVACGILLALTVVNLAMIPHPWWMWAGGIAVYVPAAWIAACVTSACAPKTEAASG